MDSRTKTQKEISEGLRRESYTPSFPKEEVVSTQESKQVSQKEDYTKGLSIGIEDIDFAIYYYFTEVIRPVVTVNGTSMEVPVVYANPEKWQAVQRDGIYRDKEGKRQIPVIIFKRNSLEKNRNITSKVDANNPHNYFVVSQSPYSSRNTYYDTQNPIALKNRLPEKSFTVTVVPDYVTLQYSCIILTDYISQMNPIIEAINFASDSYWGDKNRFKFQSFVDSFKTEISASTGEDRLVKTDFGIKLNGYILPKTVNSLPFVNFKRYQKTHKKLSIEEGIIKG